MLSDSLFNFAPVKTVSSYKGGVDNMLGSVDAAKRYLLGTEDRVSLKNGSGFVDNYNQQEEIIDWVNQHSWLSSIDTDRNSIDNNSLNGNGHSIVRIQPNYALYSRSRGDLSPIVGVMQFQLELNIESEWESLGIPFPFINNLVDKATKISQWGNSGNVGEVYKSKKVWKKSAYLHISPKFRVVDWNGDGLPIRAAIMAQRYALPYPRPNGVSDEVENVSSSVKTNGVVKTFEKIVGDFTENSEYAKYVKDVGIDASKDVISKTSDLQNLTNMAKDASDGRLAKSVKDTTRDLFINATEDLHDLFMLYDSPPPCKLQIGQFFYHPDMVVEKVNVSFSDEKTEFGPIYVDITLEMSSRKIMQGYADTGLVEYSNKSRIIREMASNTTPQTQAEFNETIANASNTQAAKLQASKAASMGVTKAEEMTPKDPDSWQKKFRAK